MATVTLVSMVDDIDGSEGAETVSFALEGVAYEIDLGDANAQKLRDALATYIAHGRRVGGRRTRGGRGRGRSSASADRDQVAIIRDWARRNGHEVSDRGRLSSSVIEAYEAAH
jgi:hypothetical protein